MCDAILLRKLLQHSVYFFISFYKITIEINVIIYFSNYYQWIEADNLDINFEDRPVLTMHSKELLPSNITRYTFSITGPDHMGLYISPFQNTTLVSWSFIDEIYAGTQTWNGRYLYFVNFIYGIDNSEYVFTLDVKVCHTMITHFLISKINLISLYFLGLL